MNPIQTKVAEQITAINPKVEDEVVGVLVKRELVKRSDSLVVVIDNLSKLELEMRKLDKPDLVFTAGGEKIEGRSKKLVEEIDKLQQKITKHEKAITKALEGDMKDVYDLKNQKPGGSGDQKDADTASD